MGLPKVEHVHGVMLPDDYMPQLIRMVAITAATRINADLGYRDRCDGVIESAKKFEKYILGEVND